MSKMQRQHVNQEGLRLPDLQGNGEEMRKQFPSKSTGPNTFKSREAKKNKRRMAKASRRGNRK